MRVPLQICTMLLAAASGYFAARQFRPQEAQPQKKKVAPLSPQAFKAGRPMKPVIALSARGSGAVPEMFAAVSAATPAECRMMAFALLNDPRRRRDFGAWGPLLARWSALDGPGLIHFARNDAAASERAWLQSKCWFAWGAAHPQAAMEAGKTLPVSLARDLIKGMAETDAASAAKFALSLPGAQFNLYGIAAKLAETSPDALNQLLPRAVYDGMRQSLQKAHATALAATDPEAALAAARRMGNIGLDPVPDTVRYIARQDPVKAAELVAKMPSSRSRALSSVALAKTWAADDPAAATSWARSLQGPVKQAALLEIAAATGGPDPGAALALVEEAGWEERGNFYHIANNGTFIPSEVHERPSPAKTASLLLQQLHTIDPAAAQAWLQRVPDAVRAEAMKNIANSQAP